MKKIAIIICMLSLLCSGFVAHADGAKEMELFTFEEYTEQGLADSITKLEQNRTTYTVDEAQAYSGKGLRITLGGPEMESSRLNITFGNRGWKGYNGMRMYVANATQTQGLMMSVSLISRGSDGAEYYMYIKKPIMTNADGTNVDVNMQNRLFALHKDFSGWVDLPFEDAAYTDKNGETTTKFDINNVVGIKTDIYTGGKDLADAAVVIDNVSLYTTRPTISTPVVTPSPTQNVTAPPAQGQQGLTTPDSSITSTPTGTPAPNNGTGNELDKEKTKGDLTTVWIIAGVAVLVVVMGIFTHKKSKK